MSHRFDKKVAGYLARWNKRNKIGDILFRKHTPPVVEAAAAFALSVYERERKESDPPLSLVRQAFYRMIDPGCKKSALFRFMLHRFQGGLNFQNEELCRYVISGLLDEYKLYANQSYGDDAKNITANYRVLAQSPWFNSASFAFVFQFCSMLFAEPQYAGWCDVTQNPIYQLPWPWIVDAKVDLDEERPLYFEHEVNTEEECEIRLVIKEGYINYN